MFSSEIKSVHFVGIGGTAMASAAAAMQEKGFCRHRLGPECLSAHVHVPRRKKSG
jgi:hypothetical protein